MYGIPFSYIIVLGLCAQIKRGAPFLISLLLKIIPLKGRPFLLSLLLKIISLKMLDSLSRRLFNMGFYIFLQFFILAFSYIHSFSFFFHSFFQLFPPFFLLCFSFILYFILSIFFPHHQLLLHPSHLISMRPTFIFFQNLFIYALFIIICPDFLRKSKGTYIAIGSNFLFFFRSRSKFFFSAFQTSRINNLKVVDRFIPNFACKFLLLIVT